MQSAERQAKEYLYDLQNKARESGFKPDEKWHVSLATIAEKNAIEKNYHAAIAAKAIPEVLLAMFGLVQTGLKQSLTEVPDIKDIKLNRWEYLVAYNPERERR
ncbi:hypothetical protein HDF19_15485 [Mucilaginibacter sp. E4BP6]|uniref:hypothetical protein n=1 Tax=Mucilaginibacter sp. E4BP6 TaxID=2723089 RepID=UPI0015CBF670|nr:hypothetical protein [Mucilaginibacter sp. E4BP6]NYE65602.1 hypothetical protein [Mucilaginibacter sp. E4BP6]